MIKFPHDVDGFVAAGDWHMNLRFGQSVIQKVGEQGKFDIIIQLGDFGYTFNDDYLNGLNGKLEEYNLILMFIRGNHDDTNFLRSVPVSEDGVRRLRSRVWHLPDGFRWEWLGKTFLALGGAVSVDKKYRQQDVSWWADEELSPSVLRRAIEAGPVDCILSHDAPTKADIKKLQDDWLSPDIRAACDYHRKLLQIAVDEMKPSLLIHGHFHQPYRDLIEDDEGWACQIIGLDCDGWSIDNNIEEFWVAGD